MNVLKVKLALIVFMLSLAVDANSTEQTSVSASLNVSDSTELQVSDFSISDSDFTTGENPSFSITILNVGNNVVSDAQARVFIFGPSDSLVFSFNYTNVSIAGGETQILTKSWDSTGFSAGDYSAYGNVSYNGTSSNRLGVLFTISAASSPPVSDGGSGTGGGGGGGSSVAGPRTTPPVIKLPDLGEFRHPDLNVIESVVFYHSASGRISLISHLLENPSNQPIKVKVKMSGIVEIEDERTMLLGAGEKRSMLMPVQLPQNTSIGYYVMSLNFTVFDAITSQQKTEIIQPMVMQVSPSRREGVVIYRQVSLEREQNQSIITLNVFNSANTTSRHIQIYEEIPKSLAQNADSISFLAEPSMIIEEDPLIIRWDMEPFSPKETRSVTYVLPEVSEDISDYMWDVSQIVEITPKSERIIFVDNIVAPALSPGGSDNVTITLFNSGSSPKSIFISITKPDGWELYPRSFSVLMPARSIYKFDIAIESSPSILVGSYKFSAKINYDDVEDEQIFLISVGGPSISEPLPPLRQQLISWLMANIYNLLPYLIAAAIFLSLAFMFYKKMRKPKYDASRVQYLDRIKRTFERK